LLDALPGFFTHPVNVPPRLRQMKKALHSLIIITHCAANTLGRLLIWGLILGQ